MLVDLFSIHGIVCFAQNHERLICEAQQKGSTLKNEMIAGLNVWHNASSRGRLFVAIHGGCGTGQTWEDVSKTFGDSVRFFAPDLPGHGGSPLDRPLGKVTIGEYTNALVKFCERFEHERIDVLGHSMSALIALQLAGRAPNIRKIVLLNGVPPWPLITPRTFFRSLKYLPKFLRGERWRYTKKDYRYLLCASYSGADIKPELADKLCDESVDESGEAAREMCLGLIRPAATTTPVMVVAARGDRIVPLHSQWRMARRYSACYYEFFGAHMSVFDPAFAWVFDHHIIPWLQK